MKKRVAVIGYGGQGAWHCGQIQQSDVVELVGIYDVREVRRNMALEAGIYVYESNEAIFNDPKVDIVVVATPNDVHEALVVGALKSGKHCICEKPVALSVDEFDRMVRAAAEVDRVFSVHQNRRWDVDFLSVKNVVESGEIGEVLRIESRIHGCRGIPGDWRCHKAPGGGMILDWGVHLIDQMLLLIQESIRRIYCETTHYTNQEVDDGFRLELSFESGKTAYVEVGTYNFLSMPRFYMQCTEGSLRLADWQQKATVSRLTCWSDRNVTPVQNASGITKTMAPRDSMTLNTYEIQYPSSDVHDYYRNFCAASEGKDALLVQPDQVRRVLKVMEACFESAERHQTLDVQI